MAPNAQRPTAVRLDDLRSRLQNTQTIAASKIRRNDVFEMFKLKNQRRTWWNETDYIIPEFDLNEFLHVPCPTNPWLDNALDLCSQVFRRRNGGDVRLPNIRRNEAPLVPDLKVNSTVYGVLSDDLRYVFVCLDNNSMVSRSTQFNIRIDKERVMDYFGHCLRVVVASRPTGSPLTARVNREEDSQVEQYDYTGFEGLQDRIFTFQGVDAEQCDLVKWPSEDVVFRN
ncbi:hypothetical protein Q9L58_005581 [Maublancomyces gigas]|uniref:Uncharacterized protein n=1 Tax=Discina gigas TaxID=1032678 RepID=A0ABR3GHP9_9PEZI